MSESRGDAVEVARRDLEARILLEALGVARFSIPVAGAWWESTVQATGRRMVEALSPIVEELITTRDQASTLTEELAKAKLAKEDLEAEKTKLMLQTTDLMLSESEAREQLAEAQMENEKLGRIADASLGWRKGMRAELDAQEAALKLAEEMRVALSVYLSSTDEEPVWTKVCDDLGRAMQAFQGARASLSPAPSAGEPRHTCASCAACAMNLTEPSTREEPQIDPEACPETGKRDCKRCSGEGCDKCGAGFMSRAPDAPPCEHDVVERHESVSVSSEATRELVLAAHRPVEVGLLTICACGKDWPCSGEATPDLRREDMYVPSDPGLPVVLPATPEGKTCRVFRTCDCEPDGLQHGGFCDNPLPCTVPGHGGEGGR
jgi:hypothetical protein